MNRAGSDIANANSSVLMPFAPFTRRSTLPTFATLTTLSKVGETKYFSIMSLKTKPEDKLDKLIFICHILYFVSNFNCKYLFLLTKNRKHDNDEVK